jgi:hypothetical protein
MFWSKLPRVEEFAKDPRLLRQTIIRILFRHGSLGASMISIFCGCVDLELVQEAMEDLEEEGRIVIDWKTSLPLDRIPDERVPYQLA